MEETLVKPVIKETSFKNLSLIPSNIDLTGAEVELVSLENREKRLKNALEQIRLHYDYIFIDAPPSLGFLTLNAITAADSVIIPSQCEF